MMVTHDYRREPIRPPDRGGQKIVVYFDNNMKVGLQSSDLPRSNHSGRVQRDGFCQDHTTLSYGTFAVRHAFADRGSRIRCAEARDQSGNCRQNDE